MSNHTEKYESEELKEVSLTSNISNYKRSLIFILSFIIISVIIGALVKYPEKIVGKVFIISENKVNNIYSPNNGEIYILVKENTNVRKGELIALIKNPTNYDDLMALSTKLDDVNINNVEKYIGAFKFDKTLKLGEIEKYYYNFLLALIEYNNVLNIDLINQKITNIEKEVVRNEEKFNFNKLGEKVFYNKYKIIKEIFKLDSILLESNTIVKDKLEESRLNMLNYREAELSIIRSKQELIHERERFRNEIELLKKERQKKVASVIYIAKKSFFELKTAIDFWKYNYTVKAPVSGTIEFYQPFLNSTQYVKKDMPLFILLPKADKLYARGIMSAKGYGTIKLHDTVYIKLKDYPYDEYGELMGSIYNKSKVFHDSIYYIDIKLIYGLKTNHNKNINFSHNMPGEVEYFTKKRSILQRIFRGLLNSVSDN